MFSLTQPLRLLSLAIVAFATAPAVQAGPPYQTDDPEPVEYKHWEFNLATMPTRTPDGWAGTLPHIEINYGAVPELQLHVEPQLDFSAPKAGGGIQYGYGETELGAKYRFIKESDHFPQVAIYPLAEVPSGGGYRGVGTRNADFFFPLWAQKTIGKWTMCGGGGYWINPGKGNKDWGFVGGLLQRQLTDKFAIGLECFHETEQTFGGRSTTVLNAGFIYDITENYHLLMSAGHSVQGPSTVVLYSGFQITYGPEHESAGTKSSGR